MILFFPDMKRGMRTSVADFTAPERKIVGSLNFEVELFSYFDLSVKHVIKEK